MFSAMLGALGCSPTAEVEARGCEPISLQSLYDAPLEYVGETICTSGFLYDAFPEMLLVVEQGNNEAHFPMLLSLRINELEIDVSNWSNGDSVEVSGRFDLSVNCYRNHVLGEPNEDGTTTFCGAGTDVPMTLELLSIRKMGLSDS